MKKYSSTLTAEEVSNDIARIGEALLFRLATRGQGQHVVVDRGGTVWQVTVKCLSDNKQRV